MRGIVRRKARELPREEAVQIMAKADFGVLATVSPENYPCTVALNHVMINDDTIIFHCGLRGEKIDNIRANPNVSFFVVDAHEVIYEQFTVVYRSAVAHGTATIITDIAQKEEYLRKLVKKFSSVSVPDQVQADHVQKGLLGVAVIKMHIDLLTAKERSSRKREGLNY
jgi:nitroimidazol reductase NimA-like FMN-containing flavoprotein (pyridoxamine 5'-phosphate oxidase superfamily)